MGNLLCNGIGGFSGFVDDGGIGGYECEWCGNHMCFGYVKKNGAICPHCFGRMYLMRN